MLVFSEEEEEAFFDEIEQVFVIAANGSVDEAEELLLEIESTIPDPKENCSVGQILLDSIFAFYDQIGEVGTALPYFLRETAYLKEKLQSGPVNGAIHFLTTGNIYYILGDLDKAREYFKLAYQAGKKDIFEDSHTDFLFLALAGEDDFQDFERNFVPPDNGAELEELTDEQQDLIDDYCEQGNEAMEEGDYDAAAELFRNAYAVLPDPKDEWEATGYITASLGDALFSAGKFKEAMDQLLLAQAYYSGEHMNPFVLLRLGATYLELGDEQKGITYLKQAYKMEGDQLFEEDEKYLDYLRKNKHI